MQQATLENLWLEPLLARNAERMVTIDRFPFVVGRNPTCDYCIDHPFVSRRHCRFTLRDDVLWIHDLASLNGTFVNGRRVWNCHPVQDGDLVSICFHLFRVKLSGHGSSAAAAESSPIGAECGVDSLDARRRETAVAPQDAADEEQQMEACHS